MRAFCVARAPHQHSASTWRTCDLVGQLDEALRSREEPGAEVGEDAEGEHVDAELVDHAGELVDLVGGVELGLVADEVVAATAGLEHVDDVLPEVGLLGDLDRRHGESEAARERLLARAVQGGEDHAGAAAGRVVVVGLEGERGLAAVHRPGEEHELGHAREAPRAQRVRWAVDWDRAAANSRVWATTSAPSAASDTRRARSSLDGGPGVAVVGVAARVAARGGLEVDPADRAPPDGEHGLLHRGTAPVLRGVGGDPGDDDGVDALQADRLGRGGGVGARRGLVRRVLVGVADDEAGGREREDGHVPAQLVVVERGLVVHDVGHDGLVGERGVERVADQLRVVAAALDVGTQPRGEGRIARHAGHPPTSTAASDVGPTRPSSSGVSRWRSE